MASLCISPVQAGIMLFSTLNSSFIFDLRRRSMRLWAVFLAIFLPAALVADGCFFFDAAADVAAPCEAPPEAAADFALPPLFALLLPLLPDWPVVLRSSSCERGFTWMIFRDRVGGGGRENWSLGGGLADDLLRDLTVSLACIRYGVPGGDRWGGASEGENLDSDCVDFEVSFAVMAGGGSSKAIWREAICFEPSWPFRSVDDAGVGGKTGRGIVAGMYNTSLGLRRGGGSVRESVCLCESARR